MSDTRLRLSILDHAPVTGGSPLGDAFWHSTKLVQLAERIGYERFWVAEHHNMPWLASSAPAVLAAHSAAQTSTIRVGTGGLMSSGADQITTNVLRLNQEDFPRLFAELLAFFQGNFPDDHPYSKIIATPGRGAMPAIWLLGSGTYSAQLAGALGLPFAHGRHFAGGNSVNAKDLAKHTGAEELMIANIMYGYEDRLRSYELIADACLTGNPAQAGHAPGDSQSAGEAAGAL